MDLRNDFEKSHVLCSIQFGSAFLMFLKASMNIDKNLFISRFSLFSLL